MLVYNAIQGVLTILCMITLGYVLSRRGWFDDRDSALLNRIVLMIALPSLMVSNLTGNFDKESILRMGPGIIVPFLSILGSYGFAWILGILIRVPVHFRGTFRALFAFSNTIFVGLPVNLALFGDKSVPYVTLYYLVNTTLFWTIGVYYIRKDVEGHKGVHHFFSWETIKRIFNPVLVAFFISIFLVFLEWKIPPFLSSAFKYIAAMTTPLSMLIIGNTISSIGLKGIRFSKEMIAVIIGRFGIAPALAWLVLSRIDATELMRNVFLVVAAMPAMTQIPIVCKAYGADDRQTSVMMTVTTTLSLFVIPLYIALQELIPLPSSIVR